MSVWVLIGILGSIMVVLKVIQEKVGQNTENRRKIYNILILFTLLLEIATVLLNILMVTQKAYTTNGNSSTDNKVYFRVEKPFSVYYTFTPYGDPRKDGQKYEEPFEIKSSGTIRYVVSFLGVLWGITESQDILLEEKEMTNGIADSSPSISEDVVVDQTGEENYIPLKSFYLNYDDKDDTKQVQIKKLECGLRDAMGNCYGGNGLYLSLYDLTNCVQDTKDSIIDASIVYFVEHDDGALADTYNKHVSGRFVIGEEYLGSQAWSNIAIKVNGENVWSTCECISGIAVCPVPFEFDIDSDDFVITMEFYCNARGKGLGIGVVFDDNVLW